MRIPETLRTWLYPDRSIATHLAAEKVDLDSEKILTLQFGDRPAEHVPGRDPVVDLTRILSIDHVSLDRDRLRGRIRHTPETLFVMRL